jgi:apolipoprotein N-acyltransferase
MEFESKGAAVLATTAATVVSAILIWFGTGLEPIWPLLWFAPFPLLLLCLGRRTWPELVATAVAWFFGTFSFWNYFRLLQSPPAAFLGIAAAISAVMTFGAFLFRALVRKGAVWSGLVAFPATVVSFEYLRNISTPHGTAGSFAYTQLRFLPFLQLASIAGPWGMTFLLMLFPASLAIAVHLRRARILAVFGGILAAVLIFGSIRLAAPQTGPQVAVGLIASDAETGIAAGNDAKYLLAGYASVAKQLAARGARIIVLPEKLTTIIAGGAGEEGDAALQRVADDTGATIIAGEVRVEGPTHYNQARVFRQQTQPRAYNKHHMLPPFEDPLTPGTTTLTFAGKAGAYGVAICKDMDFTPLLRDYGQSAADLMLVPAWDFNMDRAWHGHIAVMRAVEDGFSLVRSARNGYLTVADNRGRILAEKRSDAQRPFSALLATVPVQRSATIYLLMGDWFAWLSCALLVACIARLFLAK